MATEAESLLQKIDRISAVEAAQREPLPRSFGPYLLLASMAKGGMGEVFLARSGTVVGFEKHCVVKTLRPHLTDDREYVARFIDEARVVVQLGHKNICQVFDVGMVGERYYLAMELIAGKDLRALEDVILDSGGRVDPALAIHVMSEVLEALDYAHRFVDVKGDPLFLVHRDVSPQNVMISFEGEVKLIDFGLAASTVKLEQTSPNVVMGKLAYMAPEQVRGERVDSRTDQFAAAVMLTELCTGERYYEGKTPYEIWSIAAAGDHRPRRWGTIDVELQHILGKALSPRPDDRYPSCLALREALVAWRNAQGVYADGPALRAVMQQRFGAELKAHRELLLGVSNPFPRASAQKEPTKSFARSSSSTSPPTPVAASPSLSPTENTAPTREPAFVLQALPPGPPSSSSSRPPRTVFVAAAAALAGALAVAFALRTPEAVAPEPPPVVSTTVAPPEPPLPEPPVVTVTPPPPEPPTTVTPSTTPEPSTPEPEKAETKPSTKKRRAGASLADWDRVRAPRPRLEILRKACRAPCVDALVARDDWGVDLKRFAADLERCKATCDGR
jgi:serine/threonine protein kinase